MEIRSLVQLEEKVKELVKILNHLKEENKSLRSNRNQQIIRENGGALTGEEKGKIRTVVQEMLTLIESV